LVESANFPEWFLSQEAQMKTPALLLSASLLVAVSFVPVGSSFAQNSSGPVAENTSVNQRDRDHQTLTPMDQSNKEADLKITREIRRAIVKDDMLSTDAKNIKIITVDGAVTLRGPVKTEEEKAAIAAKAAQLAGGNVRNELEVAGK
jgi:osmotically-inducible protein OsmY